MGELLRKDDPRRKWRSFKRNAAFMGKTFFLAAAITGLWYVMWRHGWRFPEDDREIEIEQNTGGLCAIYGIFIGWIIFGSKQRYDAIVTAVMTKDHDTYLRYRDEKPPIAVHLMVALLSVPFLAMVMLEACRHALTGGVAVFAFSTAIVGFWFIIDILEHPTKSPWVDERTPPAWKIESVDKHFKLGHYAPKE